jgi:hypothetical protein
MQDIDRRMAQIKKLMNSLFLTLHGYNIYTVSSGNCPRLSCATSSSLLMLIAGPRDQFPIWRRSRRRLSVCSILTCTYKNVSFVHGLKKTFLYVVYFLNRELNLYCNHRSGHLKTKHTEKAFSCCDAILETGLTAPQ